ncbi:MAG: nuclear transport factor 2 family protein [Flavobacteriales bacterium]|nr:nuclear transport factor 2 family protein [Flavobacteriales bacterium]
MSFWINKHSFTLVSALLFGSADLVFAQSEPEKAVLKPVYELFEGMEKSDSMMVYRVFLPQATLFTSYTNALGEEMLEEMEVEKFVSLVANKPSGQPDWIEKLSNTEVRIDGNMAQVWTDYNFYVGEQFSHCGVDAFHLVKFNGSWKILQIVDTRRKEGCQ